MFTELKEGWDKVVETIGLRTVVLIFIHALATMLLCMGTGGALALGAALMWDLSAGWTVALFILIYNLLFWGQTRLELALIKQALNMISDVIE